MADKRNILILHTPASWPLEQWREATPLGNGITGLSVHGGVYQEKLLINRHDLWHRKLNGRIPAIPGTLEEVRRLMDRKEYREARDLLTKRLLEKKCPDALPFPLPLGEMIVCFETPGVFSHYRRALDLERAESAVSCQMGRTKITRKAFVSRKNGFIYWKMSAGDDQRITLDIRVPFSQEAHRDAVLETAGAVTGFDPKNNLIIFRAQNDDGLSYGCICRIHGAEAMAGQNAAAEISGTKELLLTTAVFANEPDAEKIIAELKERLLALDSDYEKAAAESGALHHQLFAKSFVEFDGFRALDNESLLNEAYEDSVSPELLEKIWRFGHYLFVCGYHEQSFPFHLYGLWNGLFLPPWAAHVANENVQAIYWHAVAGGLAQTIKPLLDYYFDKMDFYREAAQNVFGCRGIYISTYSAPQANVLSPVCPVILHFNGVAGWLARHFYDYYLATGDEECLRKKILPFMYETALFYEDYLTYDEKGKIKIYPAVSPENTP